MTNLEMLCWGVQHIAENHGFDFNTSYEDEGELCIFGGCNVPTLADVQFLCEDVHLPNQCIESCEFGIDIYLTDEWWENYANKPYVKGLEMWRRKV